MNRIGWRPTRLAALAALTVTAALLVGVQPARAASTAHSKRHATFTGAGGASPTSGALADATISAEDSGQPVVVSADTTPTQEVVANPDGTYTLDSALAPVRVFQDGSWVPVDDSLVKNPDGSYSPKAETVAISFSGGGTQPLVTIGSGATQVSTSWEQPLPTPVISGSTATYDNVYPGVDLVMTALDASYTQTLVVNAPPAAENSALRSINQRVTAKGVNFYATRSGLVAVDDRGRQVFKGSPAVMWDSTDNPRLGPPPTATNPGGSTPIPLTSTMAPALAAPPVHASTPMQHGASTELTVTIPLKTLADTHLRYPLYIDPPLGGSINSMAQVFSNGAPYYNGANDQYFKVGDCGWPGCNGIGVGRAYFGFDTSPLDQGSWPTAATVLPGALLQVTEEWNSNGCTPEPVNLDSTIPESGPTDTTTWPGPIGGLLASASTAAGGGANCQPNGANVTFDVTGWLQDAATYSWNELGFTLAAPDEGNPLEWKQFYSEQDAATVPRLTATYVFPPSTPWLNGISTSPQTACPGVTTYALSANVVLSARASNNPSGGTLNLEFQVFNSAGAVVADSTLTSVASGANVNWQVANDINNSLTPVSLPDGSYTYRARSSVTANSTTFYSAWSYNWPFIISTKPPPAPTITSFDYPEGYWGAPPGGTITVAAPGAVAIAYATAAGGEKAPQGTDCTYTDPTTNAKNNWAPVVNGVATISTASGFTIGNNKIYVKSFNSAHNITSPDTSYDFYVAPAYGDTHTRLDAESFGTSNLPGSSITATNACWYKEGPGSIWSGGYQEHFLTADGGPDSSIAFTFTTSLEADYALGVQMTSQSHYGNLSYSLTGPGLPASPMPLLANGKPATFTGDAAYNANSNQTALQYVPLGGAHLLANSRYTITAAFTGPGENTSYTNTYTCANGTTLTSFDDNGYSGGIDFFTVVPFSNATYPNLSAAMNNTGIITDGAPLPTTSAVGFDFADYNISRTQLAAIGFTPGTNVTVDSATPNDTAQLAWPGPNTSGFDNVVADGQTINYTAPAGHTHLDLLVAGTSGPVPPASNGYSGYFTVNYGNGHHTQALSPTVPDWALGGAPQPSPTATITQVAELPYRLVGNTKPVTGGYPTYLYHISIPIDSTQAITSVTLPYLGTTFLPGSPALHILAMSAN